MQITTGCTVTLRCVVYNAQGELVDSGAEPLRFTFGHGEIVPGLEAVLAGRSAGYRGRHRIAAEQAYGAHRPELVFEAVRENLPADAVLEPGAILQPGGADGRFQLKVVSLTERGALLDGNHPLAGHDLDVEVEILRVGCEPV